MKKSNSPHTSFATSRGGKKTSRDCKGGRAISPRPFYSDTPKRINREKSNVQPAKTSTSQQIIACIEILLSEKDFLSENTFSVSN